jgi:hypothetical protein
MVQSEAQKRAKVKNYAKFREDQKYRKEMARRHEEYHNKNIDKHLDTVKKYYQVTLASRFK